MKKIVLAVCLASLLTGCGTPANGSTGSKAESTQTVAETTTSATATATSVTTASEPEVTEAEKPVEDLPKETASTTIPAPLETHTPAGELGAIGNKEEGYGQGVQFNENNVPMGAIWFNDKYAQYDAYACFEDEARSKNIYLTFDQGYENGYTTPILDTLKEKNVQATFFITGDYLRHTDRAIVQRMVDEGHVLGVHGDRHKSISKLLETSETEAAAELNNVREALKTDFGYDAVYCRPPEGVFSERSLAFTQQQGYKSFMWSFAYKDWLTDAQPDPTEALGKITGHPHGGGIFLLHSVSATNAQILGDVIDKLQGEGFNLVGLDA